MSIVPQMTLGPLALTSPAMVGSELSIDSSSLDLVFEATATVVGADSILPVAVDVSLEGRVVTSNKWVDVGAVRRFTVSLTDLLPSMASIQILATGRAYAPITEFSNYAGTKAGTVKAVSLAHGRTTGDRIVISGTTNFNGTKTITVIDADSFYFTATWVSLTDESGWWNANGQGTATLISPTHAFRLIYTPVVGTLPTVNPPSGVKTYKGMNYCKVEWAMPEIPGFLGVRVQYSTDSTGINTPYQQYGALVTNVSRTENSVIDVTDSKTVDGDYTTYTSVQATQVVNFSSVTFPQSVAGGADNFYVVLSTIMQDTQTNHVYESNFNGPYQCGFVDLRQVGPSDFPYLQQKEDIATRLISSAIRNYPDLDLTPRSEIRDLHIDPISIELSNQSVREWFARCSESISALAQIDDYDGDGFSDDFNSSPYKSQVARAWNLSASDTQYLIDKQFDILAEARAGLTRLSSSTAVAMVTLYTYTRPTTKVTLNEADIVVGSLGDGTTPSLSYYARGSAVIDPQSLDSIYDPVNGWWGVQIPVECATSGAIGNVGSGTITQSLGGLPSGWFCVNLDPAQYGSDRESNAKFAERIKDRMVVGVDTGRRLGYLNVARSTPGVVDANIVASGDLAMLRDWLPSPTLPGGGKHIYGTVDVYVRGSNYVQQTNRRAFTWDNSSSLYGNASSYVPLTILNKQNLSLRVTPTLPYPLYAVAEILAVRGGEQIILGTKLAKVDTETQTVYLDPTELCYKKTGDIVEETYVPFQLNGQNATNVAVINYISTNPGTELKGWLRLRSAIQHIPSFQPVTTVYSIVGDEGLTSSIHLQNIRLIRSQDPLLEGFSNRATDLVQVDADKVEAKVKTLQFRTAQTDTLLIDSDIQIKLDTQGRFYGVNSVRSADSTTLYTLNTDYTIIPTDRYHTYSIVRTAGSTIPLDTDILVGYNKYILHEYVTPIVGESVVLTGTAATPLAKSGLIQNVWLPESYGYTTLSTDSTLVTAKIPRQSRYIKVTYDAGLGDGPVVMIPDSDYTLKVDPVTNQAYISRVTTGHIGSGSVAQSFVVSVSYFVSEVFSLTTGYPGYVEQVAYAVEQSRHAAADVLVKQMIENSVDVILSVELNSNVTPEIMDGRIRTAIGIVLSNAKQKVTQSEIIRQVKALPGVANVVVPLTKFAKTDGAYNIGHIVPTGTSWIKTESDPAFADRNIPANCWISTNKILPDQTIPSGGLVDAYVGMLYEGESYRRGMSIQDFLTNPPTNNTGAFYLIGIDDEVDSATPLAPSYAGRVMVIIPPYLEQPAYASFKITYQVWREGGYKDINLSPTEYLKAGRITIDYV